MFGLRSKPNNDTKFDNCRSELNSGLDVHKIYKKSVYIPDYLRVSFTRLRLMSHNLKIETGRWSRLPREARVCTCNSVQYKMNVTLCWIVLYRSIFVKIIIN